MICPHCQADLLRKQRLNKICSMCSRAFAFDPKDMNTYGLHDLRFQRLISILRNNAGLHYTRDQLRYTVARKGIRAQRPGCLSTMGFVSGPFIPADLAMKPDAFQVIVVNRWLNIYRKLPPGMIDQVTYDAVQTRQPNPNAMTSVLVCPERDALVCLQANNIPETLNMGLLIADPDAMNDAEREILEVLRRRRKVPIFLLHSANAASVTLAKRVKKMLKLMKAHQVIDLGLHYHQVKEHDLMQVKRRTNATEREALDKLKLSNEVREWYQAGGNSPLAALKPARLIKIATQATERISGTVAHTPEAKAEAVGFMTWPA